MMRRALPHLALLAAFCTGGLSGPASAAAEAAQESGSTRTLYLLLIRQARSDGRPRAALAYLNDFDRQYPGDLEARVLRVNCLLDLGQTDAAQAALARLPAGDRNGDASAVRGHVLAAQGAWPEAVTQYRAALVASPANPLTGNALGYALIRAGQAREAVETLKSARDLAPANMVIRNNLLLALTLAGRLVEVEVALGAIRDPAARAQLRQDVSEQARHVSISLPSTLSQPAENGAAENGPAENRKE